MYLLWWLFASSIATRSTNTFKNIDSYSFQENQTIESLCWLINITWWKHSSCCNMTNTIIKQHHRWVVQFLHPKQSIRLLLHSDSMLNQCTNTMRHFLNDLKSFFSHTWRSNVHLQILNRIYNFNQHILYVWSFPVVDNWFLIKLFIEKQRSSFWLNHERSMQKKRLHTKRA